MLPDRCRCTIVHGIEDAYGVGFAGQFADVSLGCPAESFGFFAHAGLAARGFAEEYQGDDSALHILIDTSQGNRLDVQAGLLADFPAESIVDGFAEFQDAARRLPVVVVAALDEQGTAAVVGDDTGHADGVAGWLGAHLTVPWVGWCQLATVIDVCMSQGAIS